MLQKSCQKTNPPSRNDRLPRAQAFLGTLTALYPGAILEDGTDDPYCPWFQALINKAEVLIEFSPEAVTVKTFDGTALYAASHDNYTPQGLLCWLIQFTSACPVTLY